MCTWSSWIFNSCIVHLFTFAHSLNNSFNLSAISSFKTFFLYFGIHTMWYISLYFVCPPLLYFISLLCQLPHLSQLSSFVQILRQQVDSLIFSLRIYFLLSALLLRLIVS